MVIPKTRNETGMADSKTWNRPGKLHWIVSNNWLVWRMRPSAPGEEDT